MWALVSAVSQDSEEEETSEEVDSEAEEVELASSWKMKTAAHPVFIFASHSQTQNPKPPTSRPRSSLGNPQLPHSETPNTLKKSRNPNPQTPSTITHLPFPGSSSPKTKPKPSQEEPSKLFLVILILEHPPPHCITSAMPSSSVHPLPWSKDNAAAAGRR